MGYFLLQTELAAAGGAYGSRLALDADGTHAYVATRGGLQRVAVPGECLEAEAFSRSAELVAGRVETQPLGGVQTTTVAADETEICALDACGGRLGSVDRRGRVRVYAVDGDAPVRVIAEMAMTGGLEPGPHALALHPTHEDGVAVADAFARRVAVFEGGREVAAVTTLGMPTAVRWLDGSAGTLVVAEANHVSAWDPRAGRKAQLWRLHVGNGTLIGLDATPQTVAATGDDRVVHVAEARGSVAGRWRNTLKNAATWVKFSPSDPALTYTSGNDSELACGPWLGVAAAAGTARAFNVKTDARIIGADVRSRGPGRDLLACYTDAGSIFVLARETAA